MNCPIFEQHVDEKALEDFVNAFRKYITQICKLGGFKDDFDVSQLDLTKDENLEEYSDDGADLNIPKDHEFARLAPQPLPFPKYNIELDMEHIRDVTVALKGMTEEDIHKAALAPLTNEVVYPDVSAIRDGLDSGA